MGNLRKEYWSGFLKMQVIKKSVSKWQSMSDVAKASIAFVISSFLLKGISFITTPIFTRLIDTNEYGIVAEYNSWQTILEVFALLGLTSAGVFNVGLNDYKEKRSQYMSSTLTICNLATCIVLAIILLLKSINKMVLPIVGGFACVCVMVTIAAPEIMAFLAPEDYHSGIYAVPPVVATAFLSALYNIYANIEFYHKKSSYIAGATVVSAAVNIGLNALLIPLFGFVGAAYTTLASSIVLILVHYCGYRKAQKDRVYNDKLVFLIALVCIVACETMNLLYINIIIRYIVLGAMFVIVIAYRKRIMAIVRMIKKKKI